MSQPSYLRLHRIGEEVNRPGHCNQGSEPQEIGILSQVTIAGPDTLPASRPLGSTSMMKMTAQGGGRNHVTQTGIDDHFGIEIECKFLGGNDYDILLEFVDNSAASYRRICSNKF